MYTSILPDHMSVHWCLMTSEWSIISSGTDITNSFEPPCEYWKLNPGPLQKQQALLTALGVWKLTLALLKEQCALSQNHWANTSGPKEKLQTFKLSLIARICISSTWEDEAGQWVLFRSAWPCETQNTTLKLPQVVLTSIYGIAWASTSIRPQTWWIIKGGRTPSPELQSVEDIAFAPSQCWGDQTEQP